MKKSDISLILVIFDIISMFVVYIAFVIHGYYEDLEEKEINESVIDGSDFTVMVKNLPKDQDPRLLKARLWSHLENVLEEFKEKHIRIQDDPNACKIVDINFGMSDYGILNFYLKRSELVKQEAILTIKLDILNDSEVSEKDKLKTKSKLEKELEKTVKAKDKNEEQFQKFMKNKKQEVVKAFVTFKSMEAKLRILDLYSAGKLKRWFKKKDYASRHFEGKWLDVRHPASASLILWENLGVTQKERFLRILFVSLISFILMIVTFVIIVFSRDYQSSLTNKYGNSSCPTSTISKSDAYTDYQKAESERAGLMSCY